MRVGDHGAIDGEPRIDVEVAGAAVEAAFGAVEERWRYFTTSMRLLKFDVWLISMVPPSLVMVVPPVSVPVR